MFGRIARVAADHPIATGTIVSAALVAPATIGLASLLGRETAEEVNSFPSQATQIDDGRAAVEQAAIAAQTGVVPNVQPTYEPAGYEVPPEVALKEINRLTRRQQELQTRAQLAGAQAQALQQQQGFVYV